MNVDVEKELLTQAISTNRSMDRIFPNDQISLVRRLYMIVLQFIYFDSRIFLIFK